MRVHARFLAARAVALPLTVELLRPWPAILILERQKDLAG